MPYTERLTCDFEAYPDGDGNPSRIYVNTDYTRGTLLGHKQIGRLFFALKKGTNWNQAEDLAKKMGQILGPLCIIHLAGGEGA